MEAEAQDRAESVACVPLELARCEQEVTQVAKAEAAIEVDDVTVVFCC